MDRRLIFPQFEIAPADYRKKYFDNMVNMLNVLMNTLRSPGEGRQSTLVLTNLSNNDVGLEPGSLFEVDGVVYISVLYKSFVSGVAATGAVGTVSVTT